MGRRRISIADQRRRQRFGSLIRYQRESFGYSLREAACIAGLEHTRLSRIESGDRPASDQDLLGLERAYDVPLEVLKMIYSGQIPSLLFRSRIETTKDSSRKSETYSARTTPQEKKELERFLEYLRFTQRTEKLL